jgi:hypothetical protein
MHAFVKLQLASCQGTVDCADADADADTANVGRVQKDLGGVSKDVMYRNKGRSWRANLCLCSSDH